jgi:hypothetical protein
MSKLESKYGKGKGTSGEMMDASEEPSEEAFLAIQSRLFGGASVTEEEETIKKKDVGKRGKKKPDRE